MAPAPATEMLGFGSSCAGRKSAAPLTAAELPAAPLGSWAAAAGPAAPASAAPTAIAQADQAAANCMASAARTMTATLAGACQTRAEASRRHVSSRSCIIPASPVVSTSWFGAWLRERQHARRERRTPLASGLCSPRRMRSRWIAPLPSLGRGIRERAAAEMSSRVGVSVRPRILRPNDRQAARCAAGLSGAEPAISGPACFS